MSDELKQALSNYNIDVKSIDSLNDDNDVFKVTDDNDQHYFFKIYGMDNDYDIIPGKRVYHTYEQIQLESEILMLLSDSTLKTAVPIRNKDGDFVTTLTPDADGEAKFATMTTFIDGVVTIHTQAPTAEMAYTAGVSAAQLHLESEKKLLPIAVQRPHKRQEYIREIQARLAIGTLTAEQYNMLSQCCDVIVDCMNLLDEEMKRNVGLVHTDIINGNISYAPDQAVLLDFSRSVYSYYLYDLAEVCLHGSFGGSSPDLQRAIIQGYHSAKPLTENDLYMMQVFFVQFLLMIMVLGIESEQNAWRESVLKWFVDEVHPGLMSGKGYMDPSVFVGILS